MSEESDLDSYDKYLNKELTKNTTSCLALEKKKNSRRIPHGSVSKMLAKLTKRGITMTENALVHRVGRYKENKRAEATIRTCRLLTISIVYNTSRSLSSLTKNSSASDSTLKETGGCKGTTNKQRRINSPALKKCINKISIDFAAQKKPHARNTCC